MAIGSFRPVTALRRQGGASLWLGLVAVAIVAVVVTGVVYNQFQSGQEPALAVAGDPAVSDKGHLASAFNSLEGFSYEPPEPGTYSLPAIKPAPDARLLNHEARPVELSSLLGDRYTLVSFVYLNCADTEGCPLAMATLWELFDSSARVPGLRDKMQLVTISFDPARDTPEALSLVVDRLSADRHRSKKIDWHFLTGQSAKDIEPLLAGFGQSVNRSGDGQTINHLLRLFLLDRAGQIRNVYGLGSIDPRLIVADVQTLMISDAN